MKDLLSKELPEMDLLDRLAELLENPHVINEKQCLFPLLYTALLYRIRFTHFYKEILIPLFYDFPKSQPSYKYGGGVCTMKTDGAKNSAKPPALRSLLLPDKTLEMNIKLSHYVPSMWENCVIGNPRKLNSCEYGWERNKGQKSLRPTMLPTGIKISPDEFLQTTRCKCVLTQWEKINAAVSQRDLTVQNSVIVNNAIIKV